jgi:hypothetical protein
MRLISVSYTNEDPDKGKIYWWTFEMFNDILSCWTRSYSEPRAKIKIRIQQKGE